MAKSAKCLLIGSTKPHSGKSAIALGIAHHLKHQGLEVAYGKPLGTDVNPHQHQTTDADVSFIAQTLGLSAAQVRSPLLMLTETRVHQWLQGKDQTNYPQSLAQWGEPQAAELMLFEGAGTLQQGQLFGLSLPQVAEILDAAVILVERLAFPLNLDDLMFAQGQLGDRLVGVVLNDLIEEQQVEIVSLVEPFLERHQIPLLGLLPRNALLRSVSVQELAQQLDAQVLCGARHLDIMVESLTVGAMNVSAAMKYFDRSRNMAVVTGGDRTDIQLTALEKSTHCLILTGQITPDPMILSRAEDLEVPVLSVDLDTLTTVEIIDRTFGQVRLHEASKFKCVTQLMADHFNLGRLLDILELKLPLAQSN
ncbi:MAG: phosphotransacetylase family protein [Oscillatoriales cyanobacterium SM2_3_0]|nr:phosphotransacetylase family protein [Oscillatoriales cyanobacterium SM2_3_0]